MINPVVQSDTGTLSLCVNIFNNKNKNKTMVTAILEIVQNMPE